MSVARWDWWMMVVGFAVALGGVAAESPADERPNVLLILIDDLNDWVGAMEGHPQAQTPHIDRLAQQGTLFLNAHAAAPLCGPTRAALLSGLRPSTTGLYGHTNLAMIRRNPAVRGKPLLPEFFGQQGYKTLATGKVFHEGSPAEVFDAVGVARTDFGPRPNRRLAYQPPPGESTSTDWGAFPESDARMPDRRSAQWAAEQLAAEHDRPFLLCVGLIRPHVPWFVSQTWFDKHPLDTLTLPPYRADDLDDVPETARRFAHLPMMPQMDWMRQDQRWEHSVQAYLACCTFVDDCVGQVLAALEAGPHAENTIVVLVSDHGYHLGEKGIWAKHTLWERSTRVPLIIARPGGNAAATTRRPVNHVDLYPTLLALAGLPAPAHLEGTSLVDLLDDAQAAGPAASITTHGFGNHGVRTERWRYIRYADGAEELYDHTQDPHEWTNLAPGSEHQTTLAELRAHLPQHDAPWIPAARGGATYNEYLRQLFQRSQRGDD